MRKQVVFTCLWAMAGFLPVMAQHPDSFEAFRQQIHQDYHQFRQDVLEHYDRYLAGVWLEYQSFKGVERDTLPKFPVAPVVPGAAGPEPVSAPRVPVAETEPLKPSVPSGSSTCSFDFYCLSFTVPRLSVQVPVQDEKQPDYAAYWRIFQKQQLANQLIPVLQKYAEEYQFNDWFVFQLTLRYVNASLPQAPSGFRMALAHYLLNYQGYDVRLAVEENGSPLLLVPIRQKVFARSYTELNGRRYYLFGDNETSAPKTGGAFRTCQLPENTSSEGVLDLQVSRELKLPYQAQPFTLQYRQLSIQGTVNANLRPFFLHYPQMELKDYAQSVLSASLRQDVVQQFKSQLASLPLPDAAEALLQFVQHAFSYATDDVQHGFEKPYFWEEMFLYPQCDCEDRSLFYSYLLWHVLKVENQLIGYPGHEAVGIYLSTPLQGDHYRYRGKKYFVSDPTYIGASTGMCMPDFQHLTPEIDFQYPL